MNKQRNMGNESKCAKKKQGQFLMFQEHSEKDANKPEKRIILVMKINENISS
jgi:hypothetical protein